MASDSVIEAREAPTEEFQLDAIIDSQSIQALVEDFHRLTGHVMALVDLKGMFLVRAGWRDVCTQFHRSSAECCERCRVSCVDMSGGIPRGETRSYLCLNGLRMVVTPLFVGDGHVGNVLTSQFFFEDDAVDLAAFAEQAELFGFDRDEYLAAIRAIPRYSHETIDSLMNYCISLAERIAVLGLTNLRLAETVVARELALQASAESEALLRESQNIARAGHYTFDVASDHWDCSEVLMDIFGIDESYVRVYDGWLAMVHPDDRERMAKLVADDVFAAGHSLDAECRIVRISDGAQRWIHVLGDVVLRADGAPRALFGSIQDVTDRKSADVALKESRGNLERMVYDVAEAMGRVAEARDPYTQGHQRRVASLAKSIAVRMGLPQKAIDEVDMAGLLHDVGKLRVPTEILNKPGLLSANEFALVKCHSEQSFDILKDIAFPSDVAEIAFQHHERMDGSGYPRGLSGEEILVAARILGVADVVEAMASHRPYRAALGVDDAIAEIVSNPARYDSEVVAATVSLYDDGQLGL